MISGDSNERSSDPNVSKGSGSSHQKALNALVRVIRVMRVLRGMRVMRIMRVMRVLSVITTEGLHALVDKREKQLLYP